MVGETTVSRLPSKGNIHHSESYPHGEVDPCRSSFFVPLLNHIGFNQGFVNQAHPYNFLKKNVCQEETTETGCRLMTPTFETFTFNLNAADERIWNKEASKSLAEESNILQNVQLANCGMVPQMSLLYHLDSRSRLESEPYLLKLPCVVSHGWTRSPTVSLKKRGNICDFVKKSC